MSENPQPQSELFSQLREEIISYEPFKTSRRTLRISGGELVSVVSKSPDKNFFAKHWNLYENNDPEIIEEAVQTAGLGTRSFLEFAYYPQELIDQIRWGVSEGEGIMITPKLGVPLISVLNEGKTQVREVLTKENLHVLTSWLNEKGGQSGVDIDVDDLIYDTNTGLLIPIDFDPRYKVESTSDQLLKLSVITLRELILPRSLPEILWNKLVEEDLDLDYINSIAKNFGEDFFKQILGHSGTIKPERVQFCRGTNQVILERSGIKSRISFNTRNISSFNGVYGTHEWVEIDMSEPQEACERIFSEAYEVIMSYAELLKIPNLRGSI